MPAFWITLRLVTGAALITGGLVGLVVPLVPGILLIALGLSIGITWHPRGLAAWRRVKIWTYRGLVRLLGRRKQRGGPAIKE